MSWTELDRIQFAMIGPAKAGPTGTDFAIGGFDVGDHNLWPVLGIVYDHNKVRFATFAAKVDGFPPSAQERRKTTTLFERSLFQ